MFLIHIFNCKSLKKILIKSGVPERFSILT